MLDRKLLPGAFGEYTLQYLAFEILPILLPPEIVHHDESPAHHITPQLCDLLVVQNDLRNAAHECKRILEQFLVHDFETQRRWRDFHRGQLMQAPGQIQISVRKICPPRGTAPIHRRAIHNANEGKTVFLEFRIQLPFRNVPAFVVWTALATLCIRLKRKKRDQSGNQKQSKSTAERKIRTFVFQAFCADYEIGFIPRSLIASPPSS